MGVEHLLRDIKDTTVGTLSQRVTNQLLGLKGLHGQIREIRDYLIQVRHSLYISYLFKEFKIKMSRKIINILIMWFLVDIAGRKW